MRIPFSLIVFTLACLILFAKCCGGILTHGKWGYINTHGDWVIRPQFNSPPGQFHSGIASVPGAHGWMFIDTKGNPFRALEQLHSGTEPPEISEGLVLCGTIKPGREHPTHRGCWLGADSDYTYFDIAGKKVCAPDIVSGGKFSEGLAAVQFAKSDTTDRYAMHGYIDRSGNRVINAQFSDAFEFSQGLAKVKTGAKFEGRDGVGSLQGGKFGFIDKTGQFIIKPQFSTAGSFTESGLATVGRGFIDKTGKLVVSGHFFDAGDLVNGVAPAELDNKYGFIDISGKWVQQPKWDHAESFSEGLAGVGTETGQFEDEVSKDWPISKWGFVDRNFKLTIPQKFLAVGPFSEGLAAACAD